MDEADLDPATADVIVENYAESQLHATRLKSHRDPPITGYSIYLMFITSFAQTLLDALA